MRHRQAKTIVALTLLMGCGDEITHEHGISDADRELLEKIASDVETQEPAEGSGLSEDDRKILTGVRDNLDDLGSAGAGGGLKDSDRMLLDEIAANVTPATPSERGDTCDAVVPGLEVVGNDAKFSVRVASTNPPVHANGTYEWAIQVLDDKRLPVPGADLVVEPWMMDHDHGTSAVTVVDSGSRGVYTLSDMNLFMNGLWEVRIDVKAGDTEDRVVVNTCLAEAPKHEMYMGKAVYVFSVDGDKTMLSIIDVDTMKVIKELEVGDASSWSDALPSPDGSRLFVNDTAGGKVHVFDTAMQMLTHSLEVGPSPVHLFNPNHGTEIWTHSDAQGAFYVIDTETLMVQGPVTAALGMAGHGKLLYDPTVAPKAYATNVADPAAFPINLHDKTVGYQIKLCESEALLPCTENTQCTDGGDACDIGGTDTCGTTTHLVGGTHDKAISPFNGFAYFQCSGGSPGYSLVDMSTDTVVADMVEGLAGSSAQSPDHRYLFLMDGDDVHVLDTMNDEDVDDAMTADVSFTMGGAPSARGTHAWLPGGNYNDMRMIVPQTSGTKVWILNMAMIGMINSMPDHARVEVEVGALTPPAGESHFNRRGAVAGHHFFTMSDAGIVPINLQDGTAGDPIAIKGLPARFAYVDNSGGVDTSGGGAAASGEHNH